MTDTIDRAVHHTEWLVIINECQYDYSCRNPVLVSTRGSGGWNRWRSPSGQRRGVVAGIIVGRTETRFI